MKKKIIITVCMAMTVLTGLAQSPLSFHAKAGIGTSHFHGKHSSSDTQIAYKAGVGAEYVLNKTWVLQSALEFVSIGGKDEISHIGKAKMHELYLQIPLMIAARLHLGKDYHASLSVGPYAAIGVAVSVVARGLLPPAPLMSTSQGPRSSSTWLATAQHMSLSSTLHL